MAKTKNTLQKVNHDEKAESLCQMKEQDKTPEKQLNEVEIGHLPETEFRMILLIESNDRMIESNINLLMIVTII